MYSDGSTRALPRVSFLIRRSRDQRSVSTSPGLIAAAHVRHRLLAPRHPPCALVLLIRKEHVDVAMEFSRCARAHRPALQREPPHLARHRDRQARTTIATSRCRRRDRWPSARAVAGDVLDDRAVPQSSTACGHVLRRVRPQGPDGVL